VSVNVVLTVAVGLLFGTGVYLLMERSLTRVLLGFVLVGNGVNLLILHMGGPAGKAPIIADGVAASEMKDPLPQALILTAIVITFGVTAFILAMIYRSWRLAQGDLVVDDVDDRRVASGAGSPEEADEEMEAQPADTEFEGLR
jgi:multisubunit Na+/H+ antiporter MnhC subunit